MKKSRFSESQIINILKQAEAGTPVPELCRERYIDVTTPSDVMMRTVWFNESATSKLPLISAVMPNAETTRAQYRTARALSRSVTARRRSSFRKNCCVPRTICTPSMRSACSVAFHVASLRCKASWSRSMKTSPTCRRAVCMTCWRARSSNWRC
jgi:hypothetical protein